ncbi:unnamed protein product [Lactuca saligna]|uniref:Uncharacterized protein n=1 Tax=Lactuca saligna TaxID=75948 RepID=A0AA36ELM0_LACSI|nr:unnamed protein product [Lactuca saligna]
MASIPPHIDPLSSTLLRSATTSVPATAFFHRHMPCLTSSPPVLTARLSTPCRLTYPRRPSLIVAAATTLMSNSVQAGGIKDGEMKRTFNMGIGMVLVVSKEVSERVVKECEMVYRIGEVFSGAKVESTFFEGLEPSQTMIRHLVEMEIDHINTSHPNFIGGNQVVEVASHQVRSCRMGSTTPRTRCIYSKFPTYKEEEDQLMFKSLLAIYTWWTTTNFLTWRIFF